MEENKKYLPIIFYSVIALALIWGVFEYSNIISKNKNNKYVPSDEEEIVEPVSSSEVLENTNEEGKVEVPKKDNYTFEGYYTGPNGTGEKVVDQNGTIVNNDYTENTTLYPNWVSNNDNNNENNDSSNNNDNDNSNVDNTGNNENTTPSEETGNDNDNTGNNNNNNNNSSNIDNDTSYELRGVSKNTNDNCKNSTEPKVGCLISNINVEKDSELMDHNTNVLQSIIDYASSKGSSNSAYTIYLPSGTYYFTKNKNTGYDTVVVQKSNVTIIGKGNNDKSTFTKLKPYGKGDKTYIRNGLNMFFYTDSNYNKENYTNNYSWISNVTYKNFIIDSEETRGYSYNANGKGFYLTFCRNCTWDTVTVRNTDGTCFGMDMLENVKITNCEASGCGKNAKDGGIGASGFGIGTGYSNNESVLIDNCRSYNNKKFGYFFENQSRFRPEGTIATKSNGYVVRNSVASGNLHNFGGVRANDVVLINNTSSSPRNYDVYFTDQSRNIYSINTKVNNRFTDIPNNDYAYYSVMWAIEKGISYGFNDPSIISKQENIDYFTTYYNNYSRDTLINRNEAVVLLWRMMNRPGKIVTINNGTLDKNNKDFQKVVTGFNDVNEYINYSEAVLWAKETGITTGISSTKFAPLDKITKEQFITMIYRLEGKPSSNGNNEVERAVNWAKSKSLVDSNSDCSNNISRGEAITIMYRYYNKVAKSKIDNYPRYSITS